MLEHYSERFSYDGGVLSPPTANTKYRANQKTSNIYISDVQDISICPIADSVFSFNSANEWKIWKLIITGIEGVRFGILVNFQDEPTNQAPTFFTDFSYVFL